MPLKHAPASGPCGISGRFLAELVANDERARFRARHAQRDIAPGVQNAAAAAQGQLGVLAVVKAHPGAVGAGVGQGDVAVAVFQPGMLARGARVGDDEVALRRAPQQNGHFAGAESSRRAFPCKRDGVFGKRRHAACAASVDGA